jgi:copper chaperone
VTDTACELRIQGMHCSSCGLLVDETLEELDGVIRSTTDVRRGRARIEFDVEVVSIEDLIAAIDELGYPSALSGDGG